MNEKYNHTTFEEEISILGFDYKSMLETSLYLDNKYVLLIETFKLKINPEQHSHDEVHVQFGINCKGKGKPVSVSDMSVRLIRYSGTCYEGKELDYQFYEKAFPSKDQIFSEIQNPKKIIKL